MVSFGTRHRGLRSERPRGERSWAMKKTTMLTAFILLVFTALLSGCIFPYWEDGGGGYHHHHHEGYHDGYGGGGHHDEGWR